MGEELKLHNLCQNVINDLLFAPPAFSESLTLKVEKNSFEDSDLADYSYTIEYKLIELPNFFALLKDPESEEGGQNQQNQYLELLFKQIQENIKKALWQVRVGVINKVSGQEYYLSTWVRNPEYEIQTNINLPGGSSSSSSGSSASGSGSSAGGN